MRVTDAHLEQQVANLNRLLGRPAVPWSWVPGAVGGEYKANVGNLSIEACTGSCNLVEMTNTNGPQRTHIYASTKTELHGKLEAMIIALQMAQGAVK